jgi:putative integral membrane protein (TIGR02587 family)
MPLSGKAKPIEDSLKEYARGITGGLLFSFPLLYTMEVWWAGFIALPAPLLILMGVTFLLLLGYNRFAGLRPDSSWGEIMIDSVEEMGLGLLISFSVLLMLNRIHLGSMSIDEIVGKIVIEAMVVSIGVSIGTAQLGAEEEKKHQGNDKAERNSKIGIVVLALCGSIVIGSNVAPTEEVLMIAVEASPLHVFIMSLVSILITIVVVFFSDFKGSYKKKPDDNFIYQIVFDTCICYVVALVTSAFILWFFGRFENMSFWNVFAQVIVLGVLSSLGASAGRLLIK